MIKTFRLLAFFLLLSLPVGTAYAAASLEVSPIRVTLTKNGPVAALRLHNRGTEKAVVQLSIMKWSQIKGEDQYNEVDSMMVLACPPIATIEAGKEQVVRVAFMDHPNDWSVEQSYRLFIQEVPPAPDESKTNQVQFAMRISLPVFVKPFPEVTQQPHIDWNIEQRDGGVWVTARNSGRLHVLINGMRFTNDNKIFYETKAYQYVLPGSTVSWQLDNSKPFEGTLPDLFTFAASTDQGIYQETLHGHR